MKRTSQLRKPGPVPAAIPEWVADEPATVIGEADLDKVTGGGGAAGGVIGSRARA